MKKHKDNSQYETNEITAPKKQLDENGNSPEKKEKLSKLDMLRAVLGISVIVTFGILWYTATSLSEITDTFLAVTTLLFALYIAMVITEIVRMKTTKASTLNCVCTVALLIFIFCVMLFRLDYMCAAMETKPAETKYLEILESTDSSQTEILEAAYEEYMVNRGEPMRKVQLRFYVLSLIALAVTGIPTLIVYLLDKKKKQRESGISEQSENDSER